MEIFARFALDEDRIRYLLQDRLHRQYIRLADGATEHSGADMPYKAKVYKVMIASPADVAPEHKSELGIP